MKRKIALVTFSLFAALACLALQTPPASAQARRGRALVTQLPEGAQGVVLKSNAVRLRRGFKFVKNRNGTVSVTRMRPGRPGVGGTWECICTHDDLTKPASGACDARIVFGILSCDKGTCNGPCELKVTVKGVTQGVIIF